MLLPFLLRTFGPILLRSGLGGLGGGGGGNSNPSFDDDDDDDDENNVSGSNGRKVSISLPTFAPDDDDDDDDDEEMSSSPAYKASTESVPPKNQASVVTILSPLDSTTSSDVSKSSAVNTDTDEATFSPTFGIVPSTSILDYLPPQNPTDTANLVR